MSTTTAEQQVFTVGQHLGDVREAEAAALPVGITVHVPGVGSYRKVTDTTWSLREGTPVLWAWYYVNVMVEALPEPTPEPEFAVGHCFGEYPTSMGAGVPERLSVGTVINVPSWGLVEKMGDNDWLVHGPATGAVTGSRRSDQYVSGWYGVTLHSLPGVQPVVEPTPEPVIPTETFAQYQQRFRTMVLGQAARAGVSMSPVNRGLRVFDVPEFEPTVGMLVHRWDHDLTGALPVGTVIECGGQVFGLRASDHGWELLFHDGLYTGVEYGRVITMPGMAEGNRDQWVDETPTVQDGRLIEEFKAKALAFGRRAKSENDWCSVFETTMSLLDIDPAAAVPNLPF